MAHYLVTGGAGFIGSHISEYLALNTDHTVSILDNLSTGSLENLNPFRSAVTFIEGDITDNNLLNDSFKDVDYVIHQAALPSVPRSIEAPLKSNWNNINGTLNVLVAARDCGVQRVVCASSSSVYGQDPTLPKFESLPTWPKSPYALTKLAGEHYCRLFHEIFGLETVSLRYFNVFGPRQNPDSQYAAVIPIFINRLLANKPVTIHGDGEQSRDFTYVDNVVQANILACTAPDAAGHAINIGCGQRHSINELFSMLSKLTEKNALPEFVESRTGDVKHSLADITKAKALLGYQPSVSFFTGLEETVAYLLNKHA